MLARLHTVTMDTNGQVALQHHTLLAGIVGSSRQLLVQQVLHKTHVVECLLAIFRIVSKPVGISLAERLTLLRCQHRLTLFLKEFLKVF